MVQFEKATDSGMMWDQTVTKRILPDDKVASLRGLWGTRFQYPLYVLPIVAQVTALAIRS